MIGIYRIRNNINNKIYIGQSTNIHKRFTDHKSGNGSRLLKNAFKKYNIENFSFDILVCCEEYFLDEYEIKIISRYNSISPNGYNLCSGGNTRKKLSDESKKLISKNKLGKKLSQEHKKLLSKIRKNGNVGISKKIKDKYGRVWGSINDCIKETGMSRQLKYMLSGKRKKTDMFMMFEFTYADDTDAITQFPEKNVICKTRRIKSVIDNKGNIFKTINECSLFYNIPRLSRYLNNKEPIPSCVIEYGIRYLTHEEIEKYNIQSFSNKGRSTKIFCNDGRIWNSVRECCDELNICSSSLSKWIRTNKFPPEIEKLGLTKNKKF